MAAQKLKTRDERRRQYRRLEQQSQEWLKLPDETLLKMVQKIYPLVTADANQPGEVDRAWCIRFLMLNYAAPMVGDSVAESQIFW